MKKILFFIIFSVIKASALPTVAIFTTGGTISEKTDPKTNDSIPALSGEELIANVPELNKIANIKLIDFCNLDSSQMSPEIWANLSKKVDETLKDPKIVGAVITHGTDTMAEAAFFLELTLKTDKPVVFTGAMKNSSDPYFDGPANILNAVFQVISNKSKNWGVTVNLNQYINSARYVEKTNTTNMQTFESGEKGYLGYINDGIVYRFNDRLYKQKFNIPEKLPKVILYADYSGADGSLLKAAVDSKVDGIVIESFGSGNVNADVYENIKYAISKQIAVVITTRVLYGNVFPIYGDKGGGKELEKIGAIVRGNLRGPKARLLLMLTLPLVEKNHKKLNKYFSVP
ncbi:MAG: hypothetical protein AMS24_01905 [Chlamydiae bacterium SM23_39]|nr:MAG: hypothetical protein AMS24_01905 [Chlamydiae bacterium SM23_39]